jgi:hypothetical protein
MRKLGGHIVPFSADLQDTTGATYDGKFDHLLVVERTSPMSGKTRVKRFPVTKKNWEDFQSGALIQNALPHLSTNDREFILTGLTPEEFDEIWNNENE